MNLRQHHEEARRRRLINRSAAQHRQIFFDAVRGSTVSYVAAPSRRTSARTQPPIQDIDDPVMTRVVQIGIVLAMAAITYAVRAPLMVAWMSLLS